MNIRELRSATGLSQSQLASQAGISLPGLQRIESNQVSPSIETVKKIANSIGFEIVLLPVEPDWGALAALGVPVGERARKPFKRNADILFTEILKGCSAPNLTSRERDALGATLLALKDHYPKVYKKYFQRGAAFNEVISNLSSKAIKLRRIVLSTLGQYL